MDRCVILVFAHGMHNMFCHMYLQRSGHVTGEQLIVWYQQPEASGLWAVRPAGHSS